MSEGIPETFKGKLGPLPVWAWGAIVGLIIVVYVWYSGRNATVDNGDAATNMEESVSNGVTSGTDSLADAMDGAFTTGTTAGSSSSSPVAVLDTNSAWAIRAIAHLVGKGTSPLVAQNAIGAYLDEETLTAAQQKLVDDAVRGIGQPPDGVKVRNASAGGSTDATVSQWLRLASGQIVAVMSDGTQVNKTTADYINAGMPAFRANGYEFQTYKIPSNSTTIANVAAKYGTSTENIRILNGWKSVPNLTKGKRIKVPAQKGSGK